MGAEGGQYPTPGDKNRVISAFSGLNGSVGGDEEREATVDLRCTELVRAACEGGLH